ncbi:MAG: GAF domain-containing protein [Actinobacteria bacterium]|nr:GAF domain-containing protein [Actinomycetota bacterium]
MGHSPDRTSSERPAERRLAALVEAGMVLASEVDLEALLQRIADLAREVIGASYGAVGVLGEDGTLARFVYSGVDDHTAKLIGELPRGHGVLGVIIEEGRPLRLQEITDHPRSSGFPPNHPPMHTFLGVPILSRSTVYGRLYLTEKQDGSAFSKDDERIALMFAAQAGVAIQNARLYDEVLSRRGSMAILEERERISKDLHDGVIQSIYSVGLSLQAALATLTQDPPRTQARIDDAIAELDNVVRDVRAYIFELKPNTDARQSVAGRIADLARNFEVNTLAAAHVDLNLGALEALESEAQSHVVQICREVLSNISRHAGATEVRITCAMHANGFVFEIRDDGRRFDPKRVNRGHGLTNMDERAQTLGGTLEIVEARSAEGMVHRLTVPIGRS